MSTTPYMSLELPVPTSTIGPEYAEQNTTAFEVVDAHDHTPGKGTPVPAAGLDIDDDLNMQDNELENVGAVNLTDQASSLPASNIQAVYAQSGDLWYNNSGGVPVQITQGSSIASASSPLVPAGVIWPYGGTSAPTGFLLCNGSAISRSTYSDLFAAIGTTFGVGDGSTTFNVPNTNGRAPIGAGNYTDPVSGSVTRTLGVASGAEKHQLSVSEMPSHNHGGGSHTHTVSIYNAPNTPTAGAMTGNTTPNGTISTSSSGTIINTQGSDTAHNNMQPYLVTNFIIKT